MATYKVPQDVEADDKLFGPFTFRQFVYLLIVVALGFLAWGLAQLFIGLIVIPLPGILLFGALALPLRKDQPMEIYLAAMVSFFLKPRRRLWDPEGIETLIEITVPKTIEYSLTKDLSQHEAEQRLSYLANIVDSQGWAIRGIGGAAAGAVVNSDVYLEAQGATDILDTSTSIAQGFDQMMQQSTERLKEEARQRMFQAATASAVPEPPQAAPQFDPYPTIHQAIVQPVDDPAHQLVTPTIQPVTPPAQADATAATAAVDESAIVDQNQPAPTETSTSDTQVPADIMNLVTNTDFSIETIASEANRITHKSHHKEDPDEVVISLR